MSDTTTSIGFFEKYLTAWVLLCIGVGIALGELAGSGMQVVADLEYNHVNLPVAVLIWLMIYPMMVQIDFGSITRIGRDVKGLSLTVVVNWLIKPFTMAFFALLFFDNLYSAWLEPELAQEYIAGAILLGAAPCTAMVFVWSYLSGGDPNYTLVQVSVNDLILLLLFVPIVQLLLGITGISIPMEVLITSVVVFVVIPLVAGYLTNRWLIRTRGEDWFKTVFLPTLKPVSIAALLLTLVLLFAFQGQKILANPFHILLIAIPLALQTYFIFFLTWKGGRLLKLPYRTCAPASMIGASNFFELSVAVAIALFGLNSGAALATVVGVLIEVPIMLHLVRIAKRRQY
ncbi:MAG TPA: ACR3 family arsenite efflux transporter [Flavobacteriales bacterium]|jgi:ACR3 family arsenite transporter|nr:ACR3 family arsenite efflux transporter [Flavobacteriales bacterium]MBK6550667.1 ACR3 family arsenite efflux transporter [Flavobacteriales bacterium]MBK7112679.1 ACR3 family arsenite efflux transporter [Flavobacteriales bacterium]MBK7620521.1 ACR3 family arsenite efflux transporter [Flavobacteriales bacterium]MBK8531392.1 ACR3 family arsenite efflux transporter [Flavobacteriales bacterium]